MRDWMLNTAPRNGSLESDSDGYYFHLSLIQRENVNGSETEKYWTGPAMGADREMGGQFMTGMNRSWI